MKKRKLLLILFSVFALSLFGALLFKERSPAPTPVTVTLRARFCDNALADAVLPGETWATLDGAACRILSVSKEASIICREESGMLVSFSSRLYTDLLFTVSLDADMRGGVLYAEDSFLSAGKQVLLSSAVFYGECEILSVKSAKNG